MACPWSLKHSTLLEQHVIVFLILSYLSLTPWAALAALLPSSLENRSFLQFLSQVGKEILRLRSLRIPFLEFERNHREGKLWISAAARKRGNEMPGFVSGRSRTHTGSASLWAAAGVGGFHRNKCPVTGQAALEFGSVWFGKRR